MKAHIPPVNLPYLQEERKKVYASTKYILRLALIMRMIDGFDPKELRETL